MTALYRKTTLVWLARGVGVLLCLALLAMQAGVAASAPGSGYLNALGTCSVMVCLIARLTLPERWWRPIVLAGLLVWVGVFSIKLAVGLGFIPQGSPWRMVNGDTVLAVPALFLGANALRLRHPWRWSIAVWIALVPGLTWGVPLVRHEVMAQRMRQTITDFMAASRIVDSQAAEALQPFVSRWDEQASPADQVVMRDAIVKLMQRAVLRAPDAALVAWEAQSLKSLDLRDEKVVARCALSARGGEPIATLTRTPSDDPLAGIRAYTGLMEAAAKGSSFRSVDFERVERLVTPLREATNREFDLSRDETLQRASNQEVCAWQVRFRTRVLKLAPADAAQVIAAMHLPDPTSNAGSVH